MATIGGKYLIPDRIGTVRWSWTDNEGQLQKNQLNNLLYFTDSPLNILSTTALAELIKDGERTQMITKIKYSIFTWYFGKYINTISNSEICLSEIDIQSSFRKFYLFYKIVGSISINFTFNFVFNSMSTREGPRTGKTMGFTPEV